jgi:precorrin-8X/cobalt-precorrin-8 methylmutase
MSQKSEALPIVGQASRLSEHTQGDTMENIILIGHGSPKKDANNIEILGEMLHNSLHPDCSKSCVKVAYLQFAEPDISTGIRECVDNGAKKVILYPYFLTSGIHVTKDIPEMIKEAEREYPHVEFIYAEPLGIHEKLVQVVMERIHAANGLRPQDIEKRSFEIISEEIDLSDVDEEKLPIIKRVIHATADFDFKNTLTFHPRAIKAGIEAIRSGRDILTDVEMVRTGIKRSLLEKWGGKVVCKIAQETEVSGQQSENRTRAEIGIEQALKENNNIGIIAVGNAPTALLKVIEIFNNSKSEISNLESQILVVGVPVGFVKAIESKALLTAQDFPFITNLSRKGGTPVAVAIVNALLKIAEEGL